MTNPPDFIEMTIYKKNEAILMLGYMNDYDKKYNINNISYYYKPWFYK